MTGALTLYRSSIGKKAVMALTGFILVGFVVVHMVGNLKIYTGAEHLNEYAAFLRIVGEPLFPRETLLWIARIVLLASVVLHITMAVQLTKIDRDSRPISYDTKRVLQASYASRTMRWGGAIVLLFIIYHLLHFTFGVVGYAPGQYAHEHNGEYQTYQNVVAGFSYWPVALFYIVAMGALCMHLYHGTWSMFQTLGLNNTRYNTLWQWVAKAVAILVFLGNISIPISVQLNLLS